MSTATRDRVDEPTFVADLRTRKADRIARHLRSLNATLDDVAHFTDEDRRAAERSAGEARPASAQTWRIVMDMLAGSSRSTALCPFCNHGDPEGTPGPPLLYGHEGPCRP